MSVVKGQSITVLLEITLTTAGYIPQYLLLFHHGEVDYSVMVGYMALCVCVCLVEGGVGGSCTLWLFLGLKSIR